MSWEEATLSLILKFFHLRKRQRWKFLPDAEAQCLASIHTDALVERKKADGPLPCCSHTALIKCEYMFTTLRKGPREKL